EPLPTIGGNPGKDPPPKKRKGAATLNAKSNSRKPTHPYLLCLPPLEGRSYGALEKQPQEDPRHTTCRAKN
ncbi:hypothetical protein A2U01_0056019, partial [Trifolium medium]|nr:hypothetical protein [Trifolium medium]